MLLCPGQGRGGLSKYSFGDWSCSDHACGDDSDDDNNDNCEDDNVGDELMIFMWMVMIATMAIVMHHQ